MFLHLSVSHSVHKGGVYVSGSGRVGVCLWVQVWGVTSPPGIDIPLVRHIPFLGRHPPPPETATAVDGMHPTGMHSCYSL